MRVPSGFRAATGTAPEPYTNTGWAKEIEHEATGVEMVYISAGSYTRGSPTSELGRDSDERRNQVTLTRGFYLGKYELTQGQWQKDNGGKIVFVYRIGSRAEFSRIRS